ncbi:MAG: CPBP family intramembrane metalloprotease [Clostridiales bacterium]|nr:CPBP family intramembrane metalloprotease [Clostridiales bacterium]
MERKTPTNRFRIALAIVLAILIMVVSQGVAVLPYIILDIAGITMNETAAKIMVALLYPIIAYFCIVFLTRKLLKYDMKDVGLTEFRISLPDVILSLLLPLMVAACYCLFVPGHFQILPFDLDIAVRLFASMLSTGVAVAFVEELIFRGVIVGVLERASNRVVAVIVSSLLFAVLHLVTTDYSIADSILAILGIASIGVLLSLLRFKTGSIWSSFLVHCVWNTVFTILLPISTETEDSIVPFRYVLDTDNKLITGGSYGIEGSVIVIVIFGLCSLIISKKLTGDQAGQ